jgi:hypothetical protein
MTDQLDGTPGGKDGGNSDAAEPQDDADNENPDRDNAEQDETGTQAQDVANEALHRGDRPREGQGSSHGGRTNPAQLTPDDEQDVVDHMIDMDRSGRIDMGAYEGEPESMDDEDGSTPD